MLLKREAFPFVNETQKPTTETVDTGMLNGVVVNGEAHKKAIAEALKKGAAKRKGGRLICPICGYDNCVYSRDI